MDKFMKVAVDEAAKGVKAGEGGPFGAVIVKDGKIIARAHNSVISENDPTSHAEINAIRKAARKMGKFDLFGCELYTSCEPCPMCLAAIYWARIDKMCYGCTRDDAKKAGFDDKRLYDLFEKRGSKDRIISRSIDRKDCLKPFEQWKAKRDKIRY